jgi:hypothetical protein
MGDGYSYVCMCVYVVCAQDLALINRAVLGTTFGESSSSSSAYAGEDGPSSSSLGSSVGASGGDDGSASASASGGITRMRTSPASHAYRAHKRHRRGATFTDMGL